MKQHVSRETFLIYGGIPQKTGTPARARVPIDVSRETQKEHASIMPTTFFLTKKVVDKFYKNTV
ncbi:MAG: hypothetical protein ACYYKD_13960 [Rhodospirillales bacterium]